MTWRQIHSSIPYSTSLARLSSDAERLWLRMLACTDPWGRLPGGASKIRGLCAPTLGWSDEHIADLIVELEQERIATYVVGGREYVQMLDFDEHQFVPVRRRGKSAFPDPPFPLQTPTPDNSIQLPTTPDYSSALPTTPSERKGKERKKRENLNPLPKTSSLAHPESLTAQPFVAFLVDESNRLGAPLPSRSKGQAAKILADLVAAGASDEALRTGITRMLERGRPISALTDIVREAAVAPTPEPEVDYPLLPPVAYDWVEPK